MPTAAQNDFTAVAKKMTARMVAYKATNAARGQAYIETWLKAVAAYNVTALTNWIKQLVQGNTSASPSFTVTDAAANALKALATQLVKEMEAGGVAPVPNKALTTTTTTTTTPTAVQTTAAAATTAINPLWWVAGGLGLLMLMGKKKRRRR